MIRDLGEFFRSLDFNQKLFIEQNFVICCHFSLNNIEFDSEILKKANVKIHSSESTFQFSQISWEEFLFQKEG